MKREKPIRVKPETKQVHFDMPMGEYLEFEKIIYSKGYSVSEYLRTKVQEEIENNA